MFYMKSREGGVYSESMLREDFRLLWKTGFFEDIAMDSEKAKIGEGHIVTVRLKENPIIASVSFKTGKKIKQKDILEKLGENNISLASYGYYTPGRIKKAEVMKRPLYRPAYR
ncbi:MAG: hypothetical protein MI867_19560 [Pseudomonadales bacterium]|nr:hypothetical protein [Pseudomonadales bacterium]